MRPMLPMSRRAPLRSGLLSMEAASLTSKVG